MYRIFLLSLLICFSIILQAQVSITVTNCTAGGLSSRLTSGEKSTVTNLTITGTIDARDFRTMRDSLPSLAVLELTGSTIASYDGDLGPLFSPTFYPENSIPYYAFCNPDTFDGKISLRTVSLPTSVTTISQSAFYFCKGITSITMPTSITTIESFAFSYCENAASIAIPASVTIIDNLAFEAFNGPINVDGSNTVYSSENGVLFDFDKSKLIQCPTSKAGSYTIPSTVETIGINAFSQCNKLTGSLVIPSSVMTVSDGAFRNCTGITGPLVIPASVTSIGNSAFNWMTSLTSIHVYKPTPVDLSLKSSVFDGISKTNCKLYVPISSGSAYDAASKWTDFITINEVYIKLSSNDDIISGSVCLPAFDTIIFASTLPVTLLSGSSVNAIAGKSIRFMPGFQAQSGSYMHAYITTNGRFCDGVIGGDPVVDQPKTKSAATKTVLANQSSIPVETYITVYPNPNNGHFIIELINFESNATISVFNSLGARVYQSEASNISSHEINMPKNSSGIFFVRATNGKEQFTKKMVVN